MLKPGPPRATFLKKGTTFILRYFSFFRKTESSNIMYLAFLLGPLQSWKLGRMSKYTKLEFVHLVHDFPTNCLKILRLVGLQLHSNNLNSKGNAPKCE